LPCSHERPKIGSHSPDLSLNSWSGAISMRVSPGQTGRRGSWLQGTLNCSWRRGLGRGVMTSGSHSSGCLVSLHQVDLADQATNDRYIPRNGSDCQQGTSRFHSAHNEKHLTISTAPSPEIAHKPTCIPRTKCPQRNIAYRYEPALQSCWKSYQAGIAHANTLHSTPERNSAIYLIATL
jgi:hypothetical protein